jgi:hypothetical protein
MVYTQTTICNELTSYSANFAAPAPCSIESNTYAVDRYSIRVGVYSHYVTSYRDVVVVPIGSKFYYYYAPNGKLLWTEDEARRAVAHLNSSGRFCDSFIIKNPFKSYGFK